MTIRELIEKLKPHENNINEIEFHVIDRDGIGYLTASFGQIVNSKGGVLIIEFQRERPR